MGVKVMARLEWLLLHCLSWFLLSATLSAQQTEVVLDIELVDGKFSSQPWLTPGGVICRSDATSNTRGLDLTNYVGSLRPSYGRCIFEQPLGRVNFSTSFSTYFEFFIGDLSTRIGDGMAFILVPNTLEVINADSGYLGWLNSSLNYNASNSEGRYPERDITYAVEIDTSRNFPEFRDPAYHHVGINNNSLTSTVTYPLGTVSRGASEIRALNLTTKSYYSVWIAYDDERKSLTFAIQDYLNSSFYDTEKLENRGRNASQLLQLVTFNNIGLEALLKQEMYAGFSSSTGAISAAGNKFTVTYWKFKSFYTTNVSSVGVVDGGGKRSKSLILGVTLAGSVVGLLFLVLILGMGTVMVKRARRRALAEKELVSMLGNVDGGEFGPKRFRFKELSVATKGFDANAVLGSGGFGKVYKGILDTGGPVAVKFISHTSKSGVKAFLAEVKIIGRLSHRNLVPLLGWCFEQEQLLLVYEYMPNGSLDQALAKSVPHYQQRLNSEEVIGGSEAEQRGAVLPALSSCLSWKQRFEILRGVATALVYLHEEWEQKVIHRDVKASNVLLDNEFNGRLGDFGLAKLYEHSEAPESTKVVGTMGYMAPEFSRSGKATDKTDVFSFGALALEIACGRRPLERSLPEEQVVLVDWVWSLHERGRTFDAVDRRLGVVEQYEESQVNLVLQLGLLCSHPDPEIRPSMRQVLHVLQGETTLPVVPLSKPPTTFESHRLRRSSSSRASDFSLFTSTDRITSGSSASVQGQMTDVSASSLAR